MDSIGRRHWAIAEGYIPSQSSFTDPTLISHETACILNAGDKEAHVRITIYFADCEPIGPYRVTVVATPYIAPALQRSHGSGAGTARHRPILQYSNPTCPSSCSIPGSNSRHAEVSLLSTTAYAEA